MMVYSAVNGKIYNPDDLQILDSEEMQYLLYFQKLASIFNSKNYEIWIKREDYNRMLLVSVLNKKSFVVVKIYLVYGCVPIDNPINQNVIQTAFNHFQSGDVDDLVLNRRVLLSNS